MQQQPMGYGQGIYGAYGPPANVQVVFPQQAGYSMRPVYVAAPPRYGPGYVDAGDGTPAVVFGGAYEGVSSGLRSAQQQPVYQTQPGYAPVQVQNPQLQGYTGANGPIYTQAYQGFVPPGFTQPTQQSPIYVPATQTSQIAPQYSPAAQSPQPGPQYSPAAQSAPQPVYQQPPAQYPQGAPAPAQPSVQAVYQQPPAPQSATSPQSQYPPSSQSPTAQTKSPKDSQAARLATTPPPGYTPISEAMDPNISFGATRSADARTGFSLLGVSVAADVGQAVSAAYQQQHQHPQQYQTQQQYMMQQIQYPTHLNPQDTTVQYTPWGKPVDTHHHAMKALSHSSHLVSDLSAIIGTYLAAKQASGSSMFGVAATRPEVRDYYHMMDKLEKLSVDYLAKHKSSAESWKSAVGPHRRHIFAQLYNYNELVRAFCQEMRGGPLVLPEMDSYSLGSRISSFHFARSPVRQPNLGASLSVLSKVRTVILVDDSYSMVEAGHFSWGRITDRADTRWNQARNLLAGLAPLVAAQNPHGIDLHFLNRIPFYAGLRTAQAIQAAFDSDSPNNGTPTGARVSDILDAYVSTLRYYRPLMPLNLIVITDGEAQDEEVLHRTIEHHVTEVVHRGFPAHQFGIEFVQVGDCRWATSHLEKLENEVSRHHHRFQRDVVGVTPASRISNMDPQAMLAIAVSGVDARMNGYMRSRGVNV